METVIYVILVTVWWLLSFTVLLPFLLLLRISKTFRDRWFSFLFSKVLNPLVGPKLVPNRVRGFKLLEEHLSKRNKSVPLEILEIGIGTGANLQFYPENSNLTALDMNINFEKYLRENKKKYPQVNCERTIVSFAENMSEVADKSFDVVVCTYVMCSVKNVESVLKEVKRVLKPGGKFLFVEHVAYPKKEINYLVQRYVSPIWTIYFDGCYPDRRLTDSINKAGFSNVHLEESCTSSVWFFIRPQLVGIATK